MLAVCIICNELTDCDAETVTLGKWGAEGECPGGSLCKGDDYTEDHRLDSPTHEPYSNLRGK